MIQVHVMKLNLTIWKTSIRTKKIDSLPLKIYDIVLAKFSLWNKVERH